MPDVDRRHGGSTAPGSIRAAETTRSAHHTSFNRQTYRNTFRSNEMVLDAAPLELAGQGTRRWRAGCCSTTTRRPASGGSPPHARSTSTSCPGCGAATRSSRRRYAVVDETRVLRPAARNGRRRRRARPADSIRGSGYMPQIKARIYGCNLYLFLSEPSESYCSFGGVHIWLVVSSGLGWGWGDRCACNPSPTHPPP